MILEVENIAKSFGKKKVLRDVSFKMEAGVLCGIVGENGSGKSTLLKIIVGEWKADFGKITVKDKFGYCPQNALHFPQLTVEEHFQYFSAAYGIEKAEMDKRSEGLMDQFNFKEYRREKISSLSGGTHQKLSLSIALLHQPKLLILDEPYNGFDWDTYLRFWDYTNQLRKKDCAILVISHLFGEKERFDQIYKLEKGILK